MAKPTVYPVKQINQRCEVRIRDHRKDYTIPIHWHNYYEFEIVTAGEYEHIYNGIRHAALPGQAWIMSQLDYHSLRAVQDSRIINICFSTDILPGSIAQVLLQAPSALLMTIPDGELGAFMERCTRLHREIQAKDELFCDTLVSALLSDLLITVLRRLDPATYPKDPRTPQRLQSVSHYICANYQKELSLAGVAELHNISVGHLGVLFKQTFGISFNVYLNKIRLRHACDMLLSTDRPIREIAAECGYTTTEYFHYIFQKYLGTTPGQYRQNNAAPF